MAFPVPGFLLNKGKNSMEHEIKITTEEFLTDLYGSLETQIYFNTNGKTWNNKPQTYLTAKKTLQWRNILGDDIYFIPNSGGSKDDQITIFRSAFIDWDYGKDENGNYFSLDIVKPKKLEFLTQLEKCPLRPTYIIETRNGYHLYWFLLDNPSRDQYVDIQKCLIYYFKSDPAIINPARVMRLPNYYWYKSSHSLDPFFVTIVDRFSSHFNSSSLLSSFPEVSDSDFEAYRREVKTKSYSAGEKEYTPDNTTQEPVSDNNFSINNFSIEVFENGISNIDPDSEPRKSAQDNNLYYKDNTSTPSMLIL
jgi:penicillin-binding protein-related factor A (putative recombinase)